MDPELYTKLVKHIKLKFRKTLNENVDNPLCTLQDTNDEDQLLNSLRADDMGSRVSRILNFYCTSAINEIYETWNGKLHTRNLDKRLTKNKDSNLLIIPSYAEYAPKKKTQSFTGCMNAPCSIHCRCCDSCYPSVLQHLHNKKHKKLLP